MKKNKFYPEYVRQPQAASPGSKKHYFMSWIVWQLKVDEKCLFLPHLTICYLYFYKKNSSYFQTFQHFSYFFIFFIFS